MYIRIKRLPHIAHMRKEKSQSYFVHVFLHEFICQEWCTMSTMMQYTSCVDEVVKALGGQFLSLLYCNLSFYQRLRSLTLQAQLNLQTCICIHS